jgi:hypothetical protein
MPLSFAEEMRAFLQHHYEQMPQIQEILVQGRKEASPWEAVAAATKMIGVHNEAFLLVAQEIDKLRTAAEGQF